MESTILSTVMQQSIQQLQQLVPQSKDNITKYLQDFYEIVQRKSLNHASVTENDFKTKLNEKKRKQNEITQCLEDIRQFYRKEIEFKDEIIVRNCSLIIQQQQQQYNLMEKERKIFKFEFASQQKVLQNKKEQLYERRTAQIQKELEHGRTANMLIEKEKRTQWNDKKLKLNDILLKYDTQMLQQQEELECTANVIENEEKGLEYYKRVCTSQEAMYFELMKEKENYLEEQQLQKLYEIRVKIARRTIVKFIEEHYPAWKKRKLKVSKKKNKYKYNLEKNKGK